MKTSEKMSIEQAKEKVQNGFGSIYSKDDVLVLLSNLELNEDTNDTSKEKITEEQIREFCRSIKQSILDSRDIVDTDNIELSIGYNNQIEIDDVPLSESELDSLINFEMNEFIDDNFTNEVETNNENENEN